MNRQFATILASLGGLALLITGCQTPSGGPAAGSAQAPPLYKANSTPAMLPVSAPPMSGPPTPTTPSVPTPAMPTPPTTAQVEAGNSIAQVGFFTNRCPCGGCNQCQTPQPHGYIENSIEGWNAYGIDPQEFVCDGGDHPPRANLLKNDQISGLQPEDTVVHYTTEAGDILFQPSNRVCVYSPRFASVRKITAAVAGEKAVGLANLDRPMGLEDVQVNEGGLIVRLADGPERADVARRIDAFRHRNRGVPIENIDQPVLAAKVLPTLATLTAQQIDALQVDQLALVQRYSTAAIAWSIGEAPEVAVEDLKPPTLTRDQKLEAFTVYEFPDAGRLRILKMADRSDAQPGETVTFSLRIENVGDSPVNNVVLVDNLVTRLEYIEDSQSSSREADFEAIANSEESVRLQWKFTGTLAVGEHATVEFKCRVR
jgi:uncharacterized repeat protein (TIGR01451 family)